MRNNTFAQIKIITLVLGMLFSVACRTTKPTVQVDEQEKNLTVYSSESKSSTLAKSTSHNSFEKAVKVLTGRIKKDPRDIEARLDLARIYLIRGEYDQASDQCERALYLNLHNTAAAKIQAEIEISRAKYSKAEIILNRLGGSGSKDAEVQNLLGLLAIKQQNYDDAATFFKQGLARDPKNAALLMNIGVLQLRFLRAEEASKYFTQVLRLIPDHSDALMHYGIAQAMLGKHAEAEVLYTKAAKADPDNGLIRYNLALSEKAQGKLGEAKKNADKATSADELTQEQKIAAKKLKDDLVAEIARIEEQKQQEAAAEKSKSMAAKPLGSPADKEGK